MIEFQDITACLVTKEKEYPKEVLESVKKYPFKDVLIYLNSDSPHHKHDLFAQATTEYLYAQDDDAICPISQLVYLAQPGIINLATKEAHARQYKDLPTAVGFGWGAVFPKSILSSLKKYTDIYGEDELYRRETERILMCLNYPQNRFILPITDLPSATAPDRLSMQPNHYDFIPKVIERCKAIL